MASKRKKTMAMEGEKKYSLFQWLIFVVLIPLLFALTVALIVMTIAGVNVLEKSKEIAGNIPYVSQWAGEAPVPDEKLQQKKTAELEKEIQNKTAEIEKLTNELEESGKRVEELLTEQDRLNAKLKQMQQQQQTAEEKSQASNVAETYESMDEKSIAGIIPNLTDDEAVNLLKQLSTEKQAEVFENLDAEKAAEYTKILSND